MDKLADIQKYLTSQFAEFIKRLEATKDGTGTLLDHATILFGSNMSDSNRHNNDPLPSVLVGPCERTHQGWTGPEVSPGFASRGSAADHLRSEQHSGEVHRR
jgi:hypothetical protein